MSKPTNTAINELRMKMEGIKSEIKEIQKNCDHHYPEDEGRMDYDTWKETCSKCGYDDITTL